MERLCKNCGSVGFPKKKCKGRGIVELIFWLTPFVILLCTFSYHSSEYNMTFDQFLSYISHPYENAVNTFAVSGDTTGFGDIQALRSLTSTLPSDKVLKLISEQENTIILINLTFLLFWLIAIIYSLWRWLSKRAVCSVCGAETNYLIPLDTPLASNLLNQRKQDSPQVETKLDVLPQLEKLAEMKGKGILTEEEYLKMKQRIMSVGK
jgi:hypothetical protein